MATKQKAGGESANVFTAGDEQFSVDRLPLRKIFKLARLIQAGFGDLIDFLNNTLPESVLAEIAGLEDAEAQQKVIHRHMQSGEWTMRGQLAKLAEKEDVFYDILSLILGKEPEWIAEHVFLETAVQIIPAIMEAELTGDFFKGIVKFRRVVEDITEKVQGPPNGLAPAGLSPEPEREAALPA